MIINSLAKKNFIYNNPLFWPHPRFMWEHCDLNSCWKRIIIHIYLNDTHLKGIRVVLRLTRLTL